MAEELTAKVVAQEAKEAGLSYVSDASKGIRRIQTARGFSCTDPNGQRVKDKDILDRIQKIVIPPAWTDVWICAKANGHLQATGRDERGRKQYRYHEEWRRKRDETKFHHMLAFARALPPLRRRVKRDIVSKKSPRAKVLATVVKLLEGTLIRVGNDEYARDNKSYGLTTMRKRHVKVKGPEVSFSFRGKSGKSHEISLKDKQVARMIKHCQELPGQELFAYKDLDGKVHDIGSQDVNDYLKEATKSDFTAKDFRTWAGTILAALALKEFSTVTSDKEAKHNILTGIEAVARMLGNTPTVCKKCYIHPEILNSYLEGTTIDTVSQRLSPKLPHLKQLKPDEAAVVVLLQRRLGGTKKERSGKSIRVA